MWWRKNHGCQRTTKGGVENGLKMFESTFFLLILDLFYVTIRSKQLIVKKRNRRAASSHLLNMRFMQLGQEEFGRVSRFDFFLSVTWNIEISHFALCSFRGLQELLTVKLVCHNPNVLKVLYRDGLSLTTSREIVRCVVGNCPISFNWSENI